MPKLPPVDPEVLLLLMLGGAVLGALTTLVTYIGTQIATQLGGELQVLPEISQEG